MANNIEVTPEMIEAGVKELRANLDLSEGLLDELEDDSNLHISLRAAYLAMSRVSPEGDVEKVRTAIARELDREELEPFYRLDNAARAAMAAMRGEAATKKGRPG